MSSNTKPRILIVGAGSMGLIIGYHLHLAGSDVTFLIRPHRAEGLNHTQLLFSYDDNKVREFKVYKYITDPSKIIGADYDYILITLDGFALQNEVGQALVKTVGEAVRQTKTKVILISIAFNIRSWFLKASGLAEDQLACGVLTVHAYSPKVVSLPLYPEVDQKLIGTADLAYADRITPSFYLDDIAPDAANGFMNIYNASGAKPGVVVPESQMWVNWMPMFALFAAEEILGWPKIKDIDEKGDIWRLGVAAVKEIQSLSLYGEPGQQAAKATTETGLKAALAGFEETLWPLNFREFNRYHHGGKVNPQDRTILRDCVVAGNEEGKPMTALKELLQRSERN